MGHTSVMQLIGNFGKVKLIIYRQFLKSRIIYQKLWLKDTTHLKMC